MDEKNKIATRQSYGEELAELGEKNKDIVQNICNECGKEFIIAKFKQKTSKLLFHNKIPFLSNYS